MVCIGIVPKEAIERIEPFAGETIGFESSTLPETMEKMTTRFNSAVCVIQRFYVLGNQIHDVVNRVVKPPLDYGEFRESIEQEEDRDEK